MRRLTERDEHKRGIWVEDSFCSYHFFDRDGDMYSVINKLAHYEDMEEAGKLIEQKHGRWDYNNYKQMYCSNCGEYPEIAVEWNYCPNCGAKMLEGTEK